MNSDVGYGAWLYTERAETAVESRGTSHVTTKQRCKYTTSMDGKKKRKKFLVEVHSVRTLQEQA